MKPEFLKHVNPETVTKRRETGSLLAFAFRQVDTICIQGTVLQDQRSLPPSFVFECRTGRLGRNDQQSSETRQALQRFQHLSKTWKPVAPCCSSVSSKLAESPSPAIRGNRATFKRPLRYIGRSWYGNNGVIIMELLQLQ